MEEHTARTSAMRIAYTRLIRAEASSSSPLLRHSGAKSSLQQSSDAHLEAQKHGVVRALEGSAVQLRVVILENVHDDLREPRKEED